MKSNYDKYPYSAISSSENECRVGWSSTWDQVLRMWRSQGVLAIECYPGVFIQQIVDSLRAILPDAKVILSSECYRDTAEINSLLAKEITEDRVFGRITTHTLEELMDPGRLNAARSMLRSHGQSRVIVGTGALLLEPDPEVLVYADLARWEIQRRQRKGLVGNIGADNAGSPPPALYKRAFFVDWRLADQLKQRALPSLDFFLDTNQADTPKLVTGDTLRSSLSQIAHQPFRVVPFFDPGPWGGQWMRRVCDLPDGPPNYAWCFDCVPEENSLLFGFGDTRLEVPAQNLLFTNPRELLGDAVYTRFGNEFPIRFDFLDTMRGGNLSLQVHPLTEYIQKHFGMNYTQDESYYLLDAGEDGCVYLGFQTEVDRARMIDDLYAAQRGERDFPADRYVNRFPVTKHDHISIPAGTIHCSGKNCMVLEISATPYIFTFKLWDWGRLGMDGLPRPIHLEHGIANLLWERNEAWVRRELLAVSDPIASGDGWREERTGLHASEFIETRRHWFTNVVPHHTRDGVQVLNLVEGEEALVESPDRAFAPFRVHYAETFIIPASVGPYSIRPAGQADRPLATIKAYVRTSG